MVPVVGLEPTRGISPTDFEFYNPHRSTRPLDELSGTCYPQKSQQYQGFFALNYAKLVCRNAFHQQAVLEPKKEIGGPSEVHAPKQQTH